MNEFIKERFSYLADNKKENAPELNVSYGIDKNFLYGAGVSISSVLIIQILILSFMFSLIMWMMII